jgi:hypothetical protein|tara:strand:- start:396 stop:887 length:492 start_codon:yes stop_codon:yes gene_type:complete
MSTDVRTLNLSENDDGMVPLTTSFVQNNQPEKNVSQNKEMTMDSTAIADIMGQPEMPLEPPMMESDPRVQQPVVMQQPMVVQQQQPQQQAAVQTKNPFNLTDEQMQAVVVAACTAAAISKPVQEKLANYVPQFLNEQGHRSMVGLAATGAVAAGIFYVLKKYA